MNIYSGNSGLVERIPEAPLQLNNGPPPAAPQPGRARRKPSGLSDIAGGLGGILSKINAAMPETEDLLLIGILYLLYRESGDIEFLLIAGALLFM
jgi:hypothetical protein